VPVEDVLSKIRSGIQEIASLLELFADESVQPSAEDSKKVNQKLSELQGHLAVYAFLKKNNEIAPDLGMHARISNAPDKRTAPLPPEPPPAPAENRPQGNRKNVSIPINDKFRFINELFAQNTSEYGIALQQLNNVQTWREAEIYLESLRSVYGWKENNDTLKYFNSLVRRRFE
jgi:hypothetical protein